MPDSNVINIAEVLLDRGEAEFAQCPHCAAQTAYLAQVRKNSHGIFVTYLICVGPNCEGDGFCVPVANGYLGDPD